MLHEFLTANRTELIRRCHVKVATRFESSIVPEAVDHGVPLFLDQLTETLRVEQLSPERDTNKWEPAPADSDIGHAAALHGAELLRLGHSIDQVVHEYGDVCQSVTDMAVEKRSDISPDEFRTLNRCLDNAIADAVASYAEGRRLSVDGQTGTVQLRLDSFSAEHKRLSDIALQTFAAIRTGNIGLTGSTGEFLLRTLQELSTLPQRTLPTA